MKDGRVEVELHGKIAGDVVQFITGMAKFGQEIEARNISDLGDGFISIEFLHEHLEVIISSFGEAEKLSDGIIDHLSAKFKL